MEEGIVKLSTGQRIFKVRYLVSVPRNVVDDSVLERYRGSVHTGNPNVDSFSPSRPRICELPIYKLALIYNMGVKPVFSKPSTMSVEIYQALVDHLNAGRHHLENTIIQNDDTEELLKDLEILDQFAGWVWLIARKYVDKDKLVLDDSLDQRAATRSMPMSRPTFAIPEAEPLPNLEEHKSIIAPLVEKRITGRRGWIGQ